MSYCICQPPDFIDLGTAGSFCFLHISCTIFCTNVFLLCLQYYSSIAEAIELSPHDKPTKIFVHPGVYNETIVVDRPVTLVGAGENRKWAGIIVY